MGLKCTSSSVRESTASGGTDLQRTLVAFVSPSSRPGSDIPGSTESLAGQAGQSVEGLEAEAHEAEGQQSRLAGSEVPPIPKPEPPATEPAQGQAERPEAPELAAPEQPPPASQSAFSPPDSANAAPECDETGPMFQGGAAPKVRVETDPETRARATVVELEGLRERAEAETAELREAERAGIECITQDRENAARIAVGVAAVQDEAAPAGTVGENRFTSVNELAGAAGRGLAVVPDGRRTGVRKAQVADRHRADQDRLRVRDAAALGDRHPARGVGAAPAGAGPGLDPLHLAGGASVVSALLGAGVGPLKARLVRETLNRASITARQFIGLEFAAGNARLPDACVELQGPENFGQLPLRRGAALAT